MYNSMCKISSEVSILQLESFPYEASNLQCHECDSEVCKNLSVVEKMLEEWGMRHQNFILFSK
jgi:hypothetical protein